MKTKKNTITKKQRQKLSKRLSAMKGGEEKVKWDKSKVKEEGTVTEKIEKSRIKKDIKLE